MSNDGIQAFYSDTNRGALRMDRSTFSMQIVPYQHHEIHQGSHYYVANGKTMTNAEVVDYTLTTADTACWPHIVWATKSTDAIDFEIYETATSISGGSAVTPINNNRNSTNTSGVTVLRDPTIGDDGTNIYTQLLGAINDSGALDHNNELNLKQNTSYVFRITSQANSNRVAWLFEWYEHEDKA